MAMGARSSAVDKVRLAAADNVEHGLDVLAHGGSHDPLGVWLDRERERERAMSTSLSRAFAGLRAQLCHK